MSSGFAAFPRSVRSIVACLRSSGQGLVQGVSTSPGATALTRTSGASARARALVRLMTPALLPPEAMLEPRRPSPATEAVLTIAPRAAFSAGAAARGQRDGPRGVVHRRGGQNS